MTSHIAHLVRRLLGLFEARKLALDLPLNVAQRLHAQAQPDANTGFGMLAAIRDQAGEGQRHHAVADHAKLGEHVGDQDRDGKRFGDLKAVFTENQNLLSGQHINIGHRFLPSDCQQSISRLRLGVEP